MISATLCLMLALSPFPFEVKKGFVVEPFVSSMSLDERDDTALSFGGRLSYLLPDQTDAFLTGELSAAYHMLYQADEGELARRAIAEGQVLLYEIYNPWAARAGLGGGIERRRGQWNPTFCYRLGLGHYMTSNLGIFGDFTGRVIFRDQVSNPIEIGLSTQWIF